MLQLPVMIGESAPPRTLCEGTLDVMKAGTYSYKCLL
jgi:hypothetical protein